MKTGTIFATFGVTMAVFAWFNVWFIPHSHAPDTRAEAAPLSAIAVSCEEEKKAIVLYVQVDATHLVRFSPRSTTILTAGKNGAESTEVSKPTTDFALAYALADKAAIKNHVMVPCSSGQAT